MAVQPLGKFKFNFADLAPQVEPRRLQVLDSAPTEAPPQAAPLPAPARPRWLPRLDAALGLPEIVSGLEPHRLIRLPLLGRSELAAQGRGVEPAMARRRPGRRLLGLAVVLARSYLELTG